jgi:hypothetical protein
MASMGPNYVDTATRAKLGHFVAVAGPIDGTPLARVPNDYLDVLLNIHNQYVDEIATALYAPVEFLSLTGFIGDLAPDSSALAPIKSALGPDGNTHFDAFAGNAALDSNEWYVACLSG